VSIPSGLESMSVARTSWRAGWELNLEDEDYGDGGAEEADEDFEWQSGRIVSMITS
jgi:hypothetical protein